MRRSWEKIIALMVYDFIFFLKQTDISGLGDRVTAEINDARRQFLQQCCNNVGMQTSARRINDDYFLACNIIESLFAGSEDGAGAGC